MANFMTQDSDGSELEKRMVELQEQAKQWSVCLWMGKWLAWLPFKMLRKASSKEAIKKLKERGWNGHVNRDNERVAQAIATSGHWYRSLMSFLKKKLAPVHKTARKQ